MNSYLLWLSLLATISTSGFAADSSTTNNTDTGTKGILGNLSSTFNSVLSGINSVVGGIQNYQQLSPAQKLESQLTAMNWETFQCRGMAMASILGAGASAGVMTDAVDEGSLAGEITSVKMAGDFITASPDCTNAVDIINSVNFMRARYNAAKNQISCLQEFQTKLNSIISQSKSDFDNYSRVANGIAQGYMDLEAKYKGIADDLNARVSAPPDGLELQLQRLQGLRAGVRQALTRTTEGPLEMGGEQGQKTGLKVGLKKKWETLRKQKLALGGKWFQIYSNKVWSCFNNTPTTCWGEDQAQMSPAACIENYIAGASRGRNGPTNTTYFKNTVLNNLSSKLSSMSSQVDSKTASKHIQDDKAFIQNVVEKDMPNIKAAMFNYFDSINWQGGGVNNEEIKGFFSQKMDFCKSQATDEFTKDINESGDLYFKTREEINNQQQDLFVDIMAWLEGATSSMNKFTEDFRGFHDPNLDQWTDNCRSGENAEKALGCLVKLERMLQNGIDGTNDEPLQPINMPIINFDPQTGAAAVGQKSWSCKGYKQCVDIMKQVAKYNKSQEGVQKEQRMAFVKQHNDSYLQQINGLGVKANQAMSGLIDVTKEINNQLKELGISGTLNLENVEAEALSYDDKTGVVKTPADMQKALAATSGLQKLSDPKDLFSSLDEKSKSLDEVVKEANKTRQECAVGAAEFAALKGAIGEDCEDIMAIMDATDIVFKKIQTRPGSSSDASSLSSIIEKCVEKKTKYNAKCDQEDEKKRNDCVKDSKINEDNDTNSCYEHSGMPYLSGLAAGARKRFVGPASDIVKNIRNVIKDKSNCEDLKSAVEAAAKRGKRNSSTSDGPVSGGKDNRSGAN